MPVAMTQPDDETLACGCVLTWSVNPRGDQPGRARYNLDRTPCGKRCDGQLWAQLKAQKAAGLIPHGAMRKLQERGAM